MKNSRGFEIGSRYLATNGMMVEVYELWENDGFRGRTQEGGAEALIQYKPDGTTVAAGWSSYSLELHAEPAAKNEHDDPVTAHRGFVRSEIAKLAGRIGKMDEETARELELINQRLNDVTSAVNDLRDYNAAASVGHDDLLGRIRKLESQTYEQEKVLQGMNTSEVTKTRWDKLSEAAKSGCTCEACKRERGEAERESLGWYNIYAGYRIVVSPDRESAEEQFRAECASDLKTVRLACIEVFRGDGL